MIILRIISRSLLRHKLRTGLTLLGMVVATLAFGLLQSFIGAWYANAEAASATRLVTRSSISLVFSLPLSYRQKIRGVEGVKRVAQANWFGAIYKEPKFFFPQFAIDAENYLDMYPEYLLDEQQRHDFLHDRQGCVVGRKLADTYGFKVGDVITLKGTIFPGDWTFNVRGIYDGAARDTNTAQMFFQWDYLNETIKQRYPRRADQVGVFMVEADDAGNMARIALDIDQQFKNSAAETLSETEKAFQLGFVAMSGAIITAIRIVSYVMVFIIMAVMANTVAMTVRERTAEYATLKALGFGPGFLVQLIFGESLLLAMVGGGIGIALTFPATAGFSQVLGSSLPTLQVSAQTLQLQVACAVMVGVLAAMVPAWRATQIRIVEGLRSIG